MYAVCLDLCFPPKVQQNYRTSGDDGKQTKKDKFIEWNTILFKTECPKHLGNHPLYKPGWPWSEGLLPHLLRWQVCLLRLCNCAIGARIIGWLWGRGIQTHPENEWTWSILKYTPNHSMHTLQTLAILKNQKHIRPTCIRMIINGWHALLSSVFQALKTIYILFHPFPTCKSLELYKIEKPPKTSKTPKNNGDSELNACCSFLALLARFAACAIAFIGFWMAGFGGEAWNIHKKDQKKTNILMLMHTTHALPTLSLARQQHLEDILKP